MNSEYDDLKKEQGFPGAADEPGKPASINTPAGGGKQQVGRLQRFLRMLLVCLVVFAVAFLAGFLLDHFMRYTPLAEAYTAAQADSDQITQDLSDLQAERDRLELQVASLQGDYDALLDELDTTQAHVQLLKLLLDATSARQALLLNDVAEARTTLEETSAQLDDLLPFITAYDASLADSLTQRLSLVMSGLERDADTVRIDLDLFLRDLLDLESDLFPG